METADGAAIRRRIGDRIASFTRHRESSWHRLLLRLPYTLNRNSTALLPVADAIARILIPCSHGLPPGLRTVELVEQVGGIQQGGGTAPRQTGIHPGSWHFHC